MEFSNENTERDFGGKGTDIPEKPHGEDQDLNGRAIDAAKSKREFERLLLDFQPYLKSRVAKHVGSSQEIREEMKSAAMQAFHEAVMKYDPEKGHFYPFLERVVHRRLIDSLRTLSKKKVVTISLDPERENPTEESRPIVEVSLKAFQAEQRQRDLAIEIEAFKQELKAWGITMDALVKHSPKHVKTRVLYDRITKEVAENDEIIHIMKTKHYYPVKKIAMLTKLPHKTIERSRIFIIASLMILQGDFEHLRGYVSHRDYDSKDK
ncbi:MAG: hypothetical protein FWG40_03905 [Peptococcaceae bacterium]|nr:hypothetical protein [Peptococcaceae bacterium]